MFFLRKFFLSIVVCSIICFLGIIFLVKSNFGLRLIFSVSHYLIPELEVNQLIGTLNDFKLRDIRYSSNGVTIIVKELQVNSVFHIFKKLCIDVNNIFLKDVFFSLNHKKILTKYTNNFLMMNLKRWSFPYVFVLFKNIHVYNFIGNIFNCKIFIDSFSSRGFWNGESMVLESNKINVLRVQLIKLCHYKNNFFKKTKNKKFLNFLKENLIQKFYVLKKKQIVFPINVYFKQFLIDNIYLDNYKNMNISKFFINLEILNNIVSIKNACFVFHNYKFNIYGYFNIYKHCISLVIDCLRMNSLHQGFCVKIFTCFGLLNILFRVNICININSINNINISIHIKFFPIISYATRLEDYSKYSLKLVDFKIFQGKFVYNYKWKSFKKENILNSFLDNFRNFENIKLLINIFSAKYFNSKFIILYLHINFDNNNIIINYGYNNFGSSNVFLYIRDLEKIILIVQNIFKTNIKFLKLQNFNVIAFKLMRNCSNEISLPNFLRYIPIILNKFDVNKVDFLKKLLQYNCDSFLKKIVNCRQYYLKKFHIPFFIDCILNNFGLYCINKNLIIINYRLVQLLIECLKFKDNKCHLSILDNVYINNIFSEYFKSEEKLHFGHIYIGIEKDRIKFKCFVQVKNYFSIYIKFDYFYSSKIINQNIKNIHHLIVRIMINSLFFDFSHLKEILRICNFLFRHKIQDSICLSKFNHNKFIPVNIKVFIHVNSKIFFNIFGIRVNIYDFIRISKLIARNFHFLKLIKNYYFNIFIQFT